MEGMLCRLCVLALVLPAVIASQIASLDGEEQAQELASSASQQGRFLVNAILKSTSTSTFTVSTTISTVYFCAKAAYNCGGKRRKRRDEPVINDAQYEIEMEQALDVISDPAARELVKRSAKESDINLARVGGFQWIPTPVQAEEAKEEVEEPIVEKRSVPEEEVVKKARFFNLITLVGTVSSTSTSSTTTTIGTVALTGTTSQCPSGSITDYMSTCG